MLFRCTLERGLLLLLLWALMVMVSSTAAAGVMPSDRATSVSDGIISDHAVLVVVYLNATAYPSSSLGTLRFHRALKMDLRDAIFPELERVSDDTPSNGTFLTTPLVCSLHSSSCYDPGVAGADTHEKVRVPCHSSTPVVLCKCWFDDSRLISTYFYSRCRTRVEMLYTSEYTDWDSRNSDNKSVFSRTSLAYNELTNDSRHLVALGGDCYLLSSLSTSVNSACGKLSCLSISMIVVSCLVLQLLIIAVVLCSRRQMYCCWSPTGNDADVRPNSQLHIGLSSKYKCEGSRDAMRYTGDKPPNLPERLHCLLYDYHIENGTTSSESLGSGREAFESAGKPWCGNHHLPQKGISDGGSVVCSPPFGTATKSMLCSTSLPHPLPFNLPHISGACFPPEKSSGFDGRHKNVPSEREQASPATQEVVISKEEREQLWNQRSWLMDHVVGLESI